MQVLGEEQGGRGEDGNSNARGNKGEQIRVN